MSRPTRILILYICVNLLLFFRFTEGVTRQTNSSSNLVSPKIDSGSVLFRSEWRTSGRWTGPEWWATPLYDWKVQGGTAMAAAAVGRTLCFLPAEVKSFGTSFSMKVHVKLVPARSGGGYRGLSGGFRIGRKGRLEDFRNSVVYPYKWIDAAIRNDGRLFLGGKISDNRADFSAETELSLSARQMGKITELTLLAIQGNKYFTLTNIFPTDLVTGGISILSDGPTQNENQSVQTIFAFRDFELSGDMIQKNPEQVFGPIVWSQYTLSDNILRLQAQLVPLESPTLLSLWILDQSGKWLRTSTAFANLVSMTALFTVPNWNSKKNINYEIRMRWQGKRYSWSGMIRRDPINRNRLKVACFSCDNGYLFPLSNMVQQVRNQNPDMLFFSGDQIYESYGIFYAIQNGPVSLTLLDFLQKHYLFGWTWRDLLRDRPSVILPDDHDVYQGNLFGNGGTKLPSGQPPNWELGGYLMPGEWVKAVERINTGHLPTPAVDITLPIGIKPYFTSLNYGGVGFAVLEDRKFKTGPQTLPFQKRYTGEGAELLGSAQEKFLEKWANNWEGNVMKCALSQTIFAHAVTHEGPNLEKLNYIFDSGGWPQPARDRVVRILGDNNVLSIHGDQHLGILLKHGVKQYDDAGYAFMVPGTANGFPRAWWPGLGNQRFPSVGQKFTGKYDDGAGNPIDIIAVGNPDPGSNLLQIDSVDPRVIAFRKGSGYGMVEFDKGNKRATFSLYRSEIQSTMFQGFPQTVHIGGNPNVTAIPRAPN